MPENPLTDINDILALVEKANNSLDSKIFIPSLNKEVSVKTLSALHNKNLVKSTIASMFPSNQFNLIIHPILKEILDPSVSLSQLTLYDKLFILLQLRMKYVADDIELVLFLNEEKLEENKNIPLEVKHKLSLSKFINKIKHPSFEQAVIVKEPYALTLNYPSVEEEYQFERHMFIHYYANIKEDDKNAQRGLIGPLYIDAISQYVKSVNISGNEINLVNKSIKDRMNIVEHLPGTILLEALSKIDEVYGKNLSKLTSFESTKDGIKYKGSIEIDAKFFINN